MHTCIFGKYLFRGLLVALALFAPHMAWAVSTTFSGDVTGRAIYFMQTIAPNTNDELYQGTINFTNETAFTRDLKFIGHLVYTADPANKSTVEQNFFDAPEVNLKWHVQKFVFKAGTDIYTWGVTDAVNPVDLINMRQYYDPIHSVKLGAASASVNGSFSHFDFDVVYVPVAREAQLPGSNSRWLPRQEYYSTSPGQSDEYILPSEFIYTYSAQPEFNLAKEDNIAARMQFHFTDLDLAAYGYWGSAPVPLITPVVSGNLISFSPYIVQVNANVQLQVTDYRQLTGGISFVKTINSWQVKGEGAYTQPGSDAVPFKSWSKVLVFALEKNWNVGSDASFISIMQYATSQESGDTSNSLDSLSHIFDSNWMLGGNFTWRDRDRVTLFYSEDVITWAWLTDLRLEHTFRDDLTIGVTASFLGGPVNSALGVYQKNGNAGLDLKYSF